MRFTHAAPGLLLFLAACGQIAVPIPNPEPSIASISGRDFNVAGGETLEIRGKGFSPGALRVLIDDTECPLQALPSETVLRCTVPAIPGVALRTLKVQKVQSIATYPTKLRFNVVLGQASVNERRQRDREQGLGTPYSAQGAGGKFVVADTDNNRVLLWHSPPATTFTPPDLVLGQPDFGSSAVPPAPSSSVLRSPQAAVTDGTRVVVADTGHTRVLVWLSFPTRNGQPADLVLGQPDFVSAVVNNGGISASTLSSPVSVSLSGNTLAVADTNNSRVLLWTNLPAGDGAPADLVLGQPSFASSAANNGPNTAPCGGVLGRNLCALRSPLGVELTSTSLYVADTANHRVLVWNQPLLANQQPANFVIGQTIVNGGSANAGPNTAACDNVAGLNRCSLNGPRGLHELAGGLAVVDRNNNRVLIYSPVPTANAPAATAVLGQANFTANAAPVPVTSATTLNQPGTVASVAGHLYVSDPLANRVLGWNTVPSGAGAPANFVLGQRTLDNAVPNFHDLVVGRLDINDPHGVSVRGGRLFVTDRNNNRVLIWNRVPDRNNTLPDVVLGQPDLLTNLESNGPATPACGGLAGVNACSLRNVTGIASDGTRLAVVDRNNNRVLLWNSIPTGNHAPADLVLGQPDFFSIVGNNGPNTPACGGSAGRNACSLLSPLNVDIGPSRLLISDSGNSRVLVWNTFPTSNQQPADLVIGQQTMLAGTSNVGPNTPECDSTPLRSRCTLSGGGHAIERLGKLVVGDSGNHRVLIWNTFPTVNGAPADNVVGQQDFVSGDANAGGVSANSLLQTTGVEWVGGKLFVADRYNYRILSWPSLPAFPDPATGLLGQTSFNVGAYNLPNETNSLSVMDAVSVSVENGIFVTSEQKGARVILRPLDPLASDF